ncbi:MAG: YceI family protein [Bacteroidales bacterium]|nr:YceI family protein [Bacteroidales bacterium]
MKIFLFSFFVILNISAYGQDKILYKATGGSLSILSEAPLETIRAASEEMKGFIDPDKRSFACELAVKTLKGFNSPLQQEHFHENYMETDKYPKASFSGKIIGDIDFTRDGQYLIRAKGMLQIHGVSRERIIPVTLGIENGKIRATSEFSVAITDHDITVPRLVFQKIAEEINVSIDAVFHKTDAE